MRTSRGFVGLVRSICKVNINKTGLGVGVSFALMGTLFFGLLQHNSVDNKILSFVQENVNDPDSAFLYKESRTENDAGDVCFFFNARNPFGGFPDMGTVMYIKATGYMAMGPNGENRDPENPSHVEFGEKVEKHCL